MNNPAVAIDTKPDVYETARSALSKLLGLLSEPEPGLMTWHIAINAARRRVLEELSITTETCAPVDPGSQAAGSPASVQHGDGRYPWQVAESRYGFPQKFRLGTKVVARQDGSIPTHADGSRSKLANPEWAGVQMTVIGVRKDANLPGRVGYTVDLFEGFVAEDYLEAA